jgi:hypothetical protein
MIYGDRTKEHRNQHGRDAKGIKKPPKTRRLDKDKYRGLNGCYAFFGRIYSIKIIDVNNIGSITLAFVNNVSINLSGLYIRMSKHSFNGIDVGITFELQSCEGVTKNIQTFGYFSLSKPFPYPNLSRVVL